MSEPTREELAAEVEALRRERAERLEMKRKDQFDDVRTEAAEGLEDNRVTSDRRLAEGSKETRELAIELSERVSERERQASATREVLATKLAYDRGVESARIDERLRGHDNHLIRINGSIERTGDLVEKLDQSIEQLVIDQAKRDAASFALAADVASRTATQVTGRQFLFGLAGLVVSMGGLLIAVSGKF